MKNIAPLVRLPEKSQALAEEFGLEIYGARLDPSDPENCFNFLRDLFPERWREVMANIDGAIYAAGQHYIAAEMSRAS
ncbi:hypothetical protein [uncultured Bradyrhizobium sp.]|uniref:hypothetical protein n=1 Tax=uncultured Bradyrhizobium sp. TaxID=199684 RepID=UPI0035CA934B